MVSSMRYLGSAVGFGFGAVWVTAGIGSAILCLLLAALGYGAVFAAQRAQAGGVRRPSGRKPGTSFELDHEQYREAHDDAASPLAVEAEYGWPVRKPELAHIEAR